MMAYLLGVVMGYLLGRSMSRTVTHTTIRMSAEEAIKVIESDEAVKQLKKDLKW
jgi:hypothetical protein